MSGVNAHAIFGSLPVENGAEVPGGATVLHRQRVWPVAWAHKLALRTACRPPKAAFATNLGAAELAFFFDHQVP